MQQRETSPLVSLKRSFRLTHEATSQMPHQHNVKAPRREGSVAEEKGFAKNRHRTDEVDGTHRVTRFDA